jgi:outer membrane protein TolC
VVIGQDGVLQEYINQGLNNNLALQQKMHNYHKSLYALKKAKALFYPDVSFNARYTLAHGGRMIEFPVGDLLNPVYRTLNSITGLDRFPQVENQEFSFYRDKEHETKISLQQPIFNPSIYFNNKIKQEISKIKKADAQAYKRQLVREIKHAYFNYMKIKDIHALLITTKELLQRNVRLTHSLYQNNKITKDKLFRAKAEVSKLEQKIAEAEKGRKTAKSYLNFLINRELNSSIAIDTSYNQWPVLEFTLTDSLSKEALQNREEIDMIKYRIAANDNNVQLNKYNRLPTVSAAIDYGFQGRNYGFTSDDDFALASLVLSWNLFSGFQNNAQIQESIINGEMAKKRLEELKMQIVLDIIQAYYAVKTAYKEIFFAQEELKSSNEAFKIIDKKYAVGRASLLEFIEARTNKTQSEMNLINAKYNYYKRHADYEKATASYQLPE